MEYVALGRDGSLVSRIAFGCAAIGGADYGPASDSDSIAAIRTALDSGITLFDTADVYGFGRAETVLGAALRQAGGGRAVIATKGGVRWDGSGRTTRDTSPNWISSALDASLVRLGVDCIDIYQIHWPDASTPIEDTLGLLQVRREQGKIRYIGCSNFDQPLVERAQQSARVDSIQLGLNLLERENAAALLAYHRDHRMLTMTYSSLAHGLLTGRFRGGDTFTGRDLRAHSPLFQPPRLGTSLRTVDRLREVAARVDRSCADVALRWVLEQPGIDVAVTGIRSATQAADNAGAADWSLSAEDVQFLDQSAPHDQSSQHESI